jgi:hypothetical protein
MLATPEFFPHEAFAKAIASDPPFSTKAGAIILAFPGPPEN